MALAIVGEGQRRPAQFGVIDQTDFKQTDIILLLATEAGQRLLNLAKQRRLLPIGGKHLKQTPLPEQLALLVTGLQHAIGKQENPIPQRQWINLVLVVERGWLQHAQRQMPRYQRQALATAAQQIAIWQAAIPHFDHLPLETDIQNRGAAKHTDRENAFELGVDLAQHFRSEE